MKILVTGSDGFVGGEVVRQLLAAGYDVVGIDARTYAASPEQHGPDGEGFTSLAADVRSDAARSVVLESRPDAIIHLAAESHVDRSILGPMTALDANVLGTARMLEAARAAKVQRFVYVSTDEVYGDRESKETAAEWTAFAPSSPYAASKAAADLLVQSYARTYGMDVVITRAGNTLGPWQHPEKMVPTAIRCMRAGTPVPVYGDGLQRRQWLDVRDHAHGISLAMEKGKSGAAYNLPGAGRGLTNLDLLRAFEVHGPLPPASIRHVNDRPGHDREYRCSSPAVLGLGWRPEITLSQAIADTVAWYLAHPAFLAERTNTADWHSYAARNYGQRT